MFWKKDKPAPAPAETRPRPRPAADIPLSAEQSLDALAEILRIFGEGAFELEDASAAETRDRCDGWARHLLVGIEPPDYPPEADEWHPGADAPRDLPGMRRFFDLTRGHENAQIGQSLFNLRETIWTFIHGLRHTATSDATSDRRITHRIKRLETAAHGNSTEKLKYEALETVTVIREMLNSRGAQQKALVESLGERLERMRSELTVVRERAACDSLTHLFNRASLDEHLERILDLRHLFGREAALFMVDIDHFKWVNDNHGHQAGDLVLRKVADSLSKSFLRQEDFVARYGGEEFVIVVQEGRSDILTSLAERCLDSLRELEFDVEGGDQLRITASLGAASLNRGESVKHWIERADQALYRAKQEGRDRAVFHSED